MIGQSLHRQKGQLGEEEKRRNQNVVIAHLHGSIGGSFGSSPHPGIQDRQNKSCHPNPTALVGNWLTGGGEVIEVVKVR